MTISEDKKKTIYIGLIIFCLVTTASLLYLNMKKTAAPAPTQEQAAVTPTPAQQNTQTLSNSMTYQLKLLNDANYPAPSVFPIQRQFDVSVFNSSAFLSLTSPELPQPAAQEFGSDANPFRSIIKKN